MIGGRRGGPGDLGRRLARAEALAATETVAAAPLALLVAVLRHQQERAGAGLVRSEAALLVAGADASRAAGRFPLLDLEAACGPVMAEVDVAVAALSAATGVLPAPLVESGRELVALSGPERREVVETWLDDPALVDPRLGFWIGVAAGPLLESAAADVAVPSAEVWQGGACPVCGGQVQVSVIAAETGEFLGGSPRSLVCGRCAAWWSFPRAVCAVCGEEDPRNLGSYFVEEQSGVRVDACETCHGYVKTFDLRQPGGTEIVALVDDVATLTLDLWATEHGLTRPLHSLAGV